MTRPRRPPAPRAAIAYVRVSTTAERQDLGADAQRQAIGAWAREAGVEVLAWHLEEVSGGAPLDERPVLLAAVADLVERGAGLLVFSTLDRFSRDPVSAALVEAEVVRSGAEIVFADGSGNGNDPVAEMVRAIRLAVARFERRLIGSRIRAALAVKRGRGEMTGAPPWGFRAVPGPTRTSRGGVSRVIPVLEPCEEERETARIARELRAQGLSVRAIQRELAARGRMGRRGRPLSLATVHAILRVEG